MPTDTTIPLTPNFLSGGGEMGQIIRNINWSTNPLGNPNDWPHALKVSVSLCLNASIPMAVWWGTSLRQLCNDEYRNIMMRRHAGAVGIHDESVWFQAWPSISKEVTGVLTTGSPACAKDEVCRFERDGNVEESYCTFSCSAIRDDDENIGGVFCTVQEIITAVPAQLILPENLNVDTNMKGPPRKKMEMSEAFNQTILESSPDCLKVIDGDGRLIFMNRNGLCALEIDDFSSIENKFWWEIWSIENQQAVKEAVSIALSGKSTSFQLLDRKGDGSSRWWDVIVSPVVENSKPVSKIIAVSRDVTVEKHEAIKLEESEYRYHNMIHSSTSMILLLKGEQLVIDIANESMLRALGKGKKIIGQPFLSIVPDIIEKEIGALLHEVYKTGEPAYGYEQPVTVIHKGERILSYYNFVFQAQKNIVGVIDGVTVLATEVTSQAAFNLTIKESEERFRSLADQIPMFIYISESKEDGFISYWNKPWLDYTGQTFAEAVGIGWYGVIHPGDMEELTRIYKPAFARREAYLLSAIRVKRHDGLYRWHMVKSNPRFLPDGTFIGYIGIGYDIHESKLAVDALKESEERMRNLVEKATFPICILKGEEMLLVVANDPVFEVWNVGKEALGKPFLDIIPEMKDQPFMGWLLDVFHNGVTHYGNEEPAYFARKNGIKETAYFNFVYQPYKEDNGTISGVMVLATDVTDQVNFRKKLEISEAHFRHMTDLMPVKINNAYADGSVFYYNQSWLDFTGKSFEELSDFGYRNIMHPDELEEFENRLKKASETDTDVEMEMRFMNAEGEYIWHLNLSSPVKDENGNISLWIGVTTEIQKIKEEERLKNNFLSMASHELKTPVTTIKAYGQLAEVMLEKNADIKTLGIVKKMTKQINKLNQLISDLLDFTKIKKGKVIYNEEWFDFNLFAGEIIEDMQSTSLTHTIQREIGKNAQVFGDKDKLGQVLNNLISNAIKYSPKADSIIVSSMIEGDGMKLSVRDSGIGISQDAQSKVFDAFYRVAGDKQSTFPGMGIGLFISTEIIKKFKGRLWLESTGKAGSVFSLRVPFDYRIPAARA